MNYRHAFHAGNVADCVKHALLVWVLRALARKAAPFRVLDTHAGAGVQDLAATAAARTGEWRGGIGRLLDAPAPALADYLDVVRAWGAPRSYPGSPAIARALLRPGDQLVCCERHPEDHVALAARFRRDPQVAVHHRDGWAALRGLTPFAERRGLILIDPPYELTGEHDRLAEGIALVARRFRPVQLGWYPIKHRAPSRALHAALRAGGTRDLIAVELLLREPLDATRLNGCGLIVADAPWGFEDAAAAILAAMLARLGHREPGEGWSVTRLTDE